MRNDVVTRIISSNIFPEVSIKKLINSNENELEKIYNTIEKIKKIAKNNDEISNFFYNLENSIYYTLENCISPNAVPNDQFISSTKKTPSIISDLEGDELA